MNDLLNETFQNLTKEQLDYFAFWKKWLYKIIKIPKGNWNTRELKIPTYHLKILQRSILDKILFIKEWELIDNVVGFRKWKNIVDNARYHVWKKYLLKIDIKDFFPSISQDRLYGLFKNLFWFNHEGSNYLAWLCSYSNELPQGAPTSPMLANLIARNIDYRIKWLINAYIIRNNKISIDYSRYADDLTFSFNININFSQFIEYIINIIVAEWFFPNYRKIHLFSSWKLQKITWVVVNQKIWVWKKYYLKIKSTFHNIKNNGFSIEMERWNTYNGTKIWNVEKFQEILKWHLSFIRQISPNYYENLLRYDIF